MKTIFTILICITATVSYAQINTFYVAPNQTDVNYTAGEDSSLVVRNTSTNNNKLFLFIGGTGSSPDQYSTISNYAGNLGFDVVNISYPNSLAAASLGGSSDSLVFDKFRQEICYGTPVSPDVTVDSLNSINTRTVNLIHYLNMTFPTQNWDQYLVNPTTLDWSKIAVGGHSQGAGHACYFAKFEQVERALMFSGPNDYSDFYSNSAHWLRTTGVTEMEKHFSYLSLLDEIVPFNKQLTNNEGLGLYPLYDTTLVELSGTPYSNSHCLYTTQSPGLSLLYHNSTMKFSFINNEVWTYMLTSPTLSLNEVSSTTTFSLYPNPTASLVTFASNESLFGKTFTVQNLKGQTIQSGRIPSTEVFSFDFSTMENGIYFVSIDTKTIKLIKQ